MHWGKVLRNICSSWVSYLVTAVVGFLLAPMVVHSLGNTGYGLWTLVLSLTGYFGLLDLGIRSSVGRFVTRYLTLHDDEKVNRTVSTAVVMLAGGGLAALLATAIIAGFFFDAFRVEPQYASAGRTALLITGLNMAIILPFSVCSAILIGLERFDAVSGVTVFAELTRAALVIASLRSGHGLVTLALISLLVTFLQYAVMAVMSKILYRPLQVRFRFVDRDTLKALFGFGIFRFIWTVANQLIFYSDSLVIGIFLGAGSITHFAIGGALINYGRNVISIATDALAPSATRMDAKEDLEGLRRLMIAGTRISLILALPLCIGLFFLGRQFITLWMGPAYASSAVFLSILTIPQVTSMSQYTSALILAGMAKHRELAYIVLAEGAANLLLSVVLAQKLGLIGIAWGTVIPNLLSAGVLVPLYTLRVLKMSAGEYVLRGFVRPLMCAAPVAILGYVFSRWIEAPSWLVFGGEAAAIAALFGALSYLLCLDAGQRARITGRLGSVFNREAVANEA